MLCRHHTHEHRTILKLTEKYSSDQMHQEIRVTRSDIPQIKSESGLQVGLPNLKKKNPPQFLQKVEEWHYSTDPPELCTKLYGIEWWETVAWLTWGAPYSKHRGSTTWWISCMGQEPTPGGTDAYNGYAPKGCSGIATFESESR